MATSDLSNELAKENFRFDTVGSEKQVVDVIVKQLDDQSSDISALANKWYVISWCAMLVKL